MKEQKQSGEKTLFLISEKIKTYSLKKGQPLTIGREKYNDIVLDSLLVSRQHSLLLQENEQYFIKDLKSQNGTFVNEKSVQKLELTHRDLIKIGPYSFTVLITTPEKLDKLILEERIRLSREITMKGSLQKYLLSDHGFSGNLTVISLAEIVQMINQSLKSGLLQIRSEDKKLEPAELFFESGEISHAKWKGNVGLEAVIPILQMTVGLFEFEAGVAAPDRTINKPTLKILLEAHRLLDEKQRKNGQSS